MSDYLFDLAAMSTPLPMANYDLQLKIGLSDGTTKYTRNQLITVLTDTIVVDDFKGTTLQASTRQSPRPAIRVRSTSP